MAWRGVAWACRLQKAPFGGLSMLVKAAARSPRSPAGTNYTGKILKVLFFQGKI